MALDHHHRPDPADLADRHLPGHVCHGLHHQCGDAAGAVDLRRPADRRCDRGAREHRAASGHGQASPPGRARRHRRDRSGSDGNHLHHRCGVPAGRFHGRHHRQVLQAVRGHSRLCSAAVDVHQLHPRSNALCGLARSGRCGCPRQRPDRPFTAQVRALDGRTRAGLCRGVALGSVSSMAHACRRCPQLCCRPVSWQIHRFRIRATGR